MAAKGFESLPPATCLEVVDFIARAGGTRQLSVRLYEASLRKVVYATSTGNADWRDMVRSQLDQLGQPDWLPRPLDTKTHDLRCMALAIEKHPASARGQEDYWREATGKSRATFFRLKKEYEADQAGRIE
jgi:hypothetical protein